MPHLTIIIALVILIIGAVAQARRPGSPQQTQTSDVLSKSSKVSTPTPTNGPHPTPTPLPTRTPSPTPPSSGQAQEISLSELQYPNATVKTSESSSLNLESSDDSDSITEWYKDKIKSMGMNAKSFVVTKTNGNVKNVLVGANGKIEIRVEITKQASENTVRIVVTYHTY